MAAEVGAGTSGVRSNCKHRLGEADCNLIFYPDDRPLDLGDPTFGIGMVDATGLEPVTPCV